ncbi:DUF485 domain-containing protein [Thermodesulfitimonas sp.]
MKDLHKIEELHEFKSLVRSRWAVAGILTLLVFVSYYGFVLMIGYSKGTLARKISEVTTLGIPLAVAVIVFSFILTLVYVFWANSSYDTRVEYLRKSLDN